MEVQEMRRDINLSLRERRGRGRFALLSWQRQYFFGGQDINGSRGEWPRREKNRLWSCYSTRAPDPPLCYGKVCRFYGLEFFILWWRREEWRGSFYTLLYSPFFILWARVASWMAKSDCLVPWNRSAGRKKTTSGLWKTTSTHLMRGNWEGPTHFWV